MKNKILQRKHERECALCMCMRFILVVDKKQTEYQTESFQLKTSLLSQLLNIKLMHNV